MTAFLHSHSGRKGTPLFYAFCYAVRAYAGLSLISKEKIDAIHKAVRELEHAGYIVRSRERNGSNTYGR